MHIRAIVLAFVVVLVAGPARAAPGAADPASLLVGQPVSKAVEQLDARLKASPADDATRFALGVGQTLRAVERLAGGLYELGPRQTGWAKDMPFVRLGVPDNPDPKEVSADDLDKLLAQFVDDLAVARGTLEPVKDANVKLPLAVPLIQLDLNGDAPGGGEPLWQILARLGAVRGGGTGDADVAKLSGLVVAFDYGDVCWLRGYTHLLSAMADLALAYDKSELVRTAGHVYFRRVAGAPDFGQRTAPLMPIDDDTDLLDAIAFIHLLRLPVRDAKRTASARQHLLSVMDESRKSWAAIRAEADDDREWIPNAKQRTVIPNLRVTPEVIDAWLAFLDDARQVLEGKRLIPFWRTKDGRGVNVRRLLEQPTTFDLVLWAQGSALVPYLERGDLANANTVRQLERVLEGNWMLFAAVVN